MARVAQPQVSDGLLRMEGAEPTAVGSPEWYAWLAVDVPRAFTYSDDGGSFSARRERQRNGLYWYAYRRRGGVLRKAYLGRAADVTPDRLAAAAATLNSADAASRSARRPAVPPAARLLATKLEPPPAQPALLGRARLAARLDEALRHPLTLVCAPAGWGKTTLVSGWLRHFGLPIADPAENPKSQIQNRKSAWLSLEPADNDPVRFWSYFAAALDKLLPGVAAAVDVLRIGLRPAAPDELALAVAHFLAERPELSAPHVLVLDDYHLLDDPAIHRGLALLLDHLPRELHLLICARVEPPLPLSRLRARGQLAELRADDLRFTIDEAAVFVRDVLRRPLPPAELAALAQRTEGWAAGLQLAALSWRGEEPDASASTDRYALEFLADEVLDRQPAPLRRFLLHTAVLDRMCGPLCDALLATVDGRRQTAEGGIDDRHAVSGQRSVVVLQEIERANLFLVPLDNERRWYRYHHLFAEMLRERLQREEGWLVPELHCRAARWFHAQGLSDEAIGHALSAGDHTLASELIEAVAVDTFWVRGEVHTLRGWLRALPADQRIARPRCAAAYAWTLLATLRLAELESLLPAAKEAVMGDDASRGELLAIESYLAQLGGNPARAIALARAGLDLLPPDLPTVRAMTCLNIASAHVALGDVRAVDAVAAQIAELAARLSGPIGRMLAVGATASSLVLRARLPHALDLAERTLRNAEEDGTRRHPTAGMVLMDVALVNYEWNQLDAATRALDEALDLGQHWWNSDILINGYNLRGRMALARGERAEATRWFERADELMIAYNTPALRQLVRDGEALWRLAVGDVAAAEAWEHTCGLLLADDPDVRRYQGYLALVRLGMARGSAAPTLGMLGRLLGQAEAGAYIERVIELLKLQALAFALLGDQEEALAALERALALAEPNGHVRTFIDEGAPMAALLRLARSVGMRGRYVARLLAAFPSPERTAADTLSEPLTPREAEVLRHLADHWPLTAIAATLVIAPSTLRSHIKNLYAKLGAHSRLEAVAQARALGLLPRS